MTTLYEERTFLTNGIDARHAMIWHQERILAYDLAKAMIQKPKVTVWMIMLPLLFLFFMQDLKKYKAAIGGFAEGFLKNKKIALDLACNAVRKGSSLDEARAEWISGITSATAQHPGLIEKQIDEIAWLMNHYRRLLTAGGNRYEMLVKNAYQSISGYQDFLDTLANLENAVISSALASHPPDENAHKLAGLMQSTIRRIRHRDRDRIFHS